MDRKYTVYEHTDPNGKKYIGITKNNAYKRWGKSGRGYTRENGYLANAIKKHGWDNFTHDILATGLSKEEAVEMEKSLIALHKTQDRRYGFNLTSGGEGTEGLSKDSLDKIREAIIKPVNQYSLEGEYIHTFDSAVQAARNTFVGSKYGSSGIGAVCRGRVKSYRGFQWRYDIGENRTKIEATSRMPNNTPIDQCDISGFCVQTYVSAKVAASTINGDAGNITKCCKGKNKTAYGFQWKYNGF